MGNNFENDIQRIMQHIVDNWNINNPLSPTPYIALPNLESQRPDNEIWVRLTIQNSNRKPISSVSRATAGIGIIIFQIFIPLHLGDSNGIALADHIANFISVVQIDSGLWTDAAEVKNVGIDSVGTDGFSWYQVNVETIFHSHHCN